MSSERTPGTGFRIDQRIAERRGNAFVVLGSALVAATVSFCGGSGDAPSGTETGTASPGETTPKPTLVETAGPTSEVTPLITKPPTTKPTETTKPPTTEPPFEPESLLDAEFMETSIGEVSTSLTGAYTAHPEAENLEYQGAHITKDTALGNLSICEFGQDNDFGDPKLVALSRINSCIGLASIAYSYYKNYGLEEFFESSVKLVNYIKGAYPDRVDAINDQLAVYLSRS